MKITLPAATLFCLAFLASTAFGQAAPSAIDRYLDTSNTILIVKCVEVGPVNILLRANVRVEMLLVVKGKEERRELTVLSQYGMTPGHRYLLRLDPGGKPGAYFAGSRESVIELSDSEDVAFLKTLSPRIIVLRTMNLRIYSLEAKVASLTYELDALKAARREN